MTQPVYGLDYPNGFFYFLDVTFFRGQSHFPLTLQLHRTWRFIEKRASHATVLLYNNIRKILEAKYFHIIQNYYKPIYVIKLLLIYLVFLIFKFYRLELLS